MIWAKAEGASGSCAWGSFRSAVNPVLRDVTERVIVASKGRFDRARTVEARKAQGLPWQSWVSNDEFMEATLDLWRIAPESARRVNHPAPFPVEVPLRLIDLYTFEGDLVLDPFLGSGSTAVAAARRRRRFAGYDTDATYVEIARSRVAEELAPRDARPRSASRPKTVASEPGDVGEDVQSRATRAGKGAQALAEQAVLDAGFTIEERNHKVPGLGITVGIVARDARGERWYLDVTGAFTTTRGGRARPTGRRQTGRPAHLVSPSPAQHGRPCAPSGGSRPVVRRHRDPLPVGMRPAPRLRPGRSPRPAPTRLLDGHGAGAAAPSDPHRCGGVVAQGAKRYLSRTCNKAFTCRSQP